MPKNRPARYRPALSYLYRSLYPYLKWYVAASVTALALTGLNLLQAQLTARLINGSVARDRKEIFLSLLCLTAALAAAALLTLVSGRCVARLSAGASRDLKKRIYSRLLHAEYAQLAGVKTGDALSTASGDVAAVCDFLAGDFTGLFSQFVMAIGALCYLIAVNPLLCLITFLYTPVGMFFTLTLNGKMNALYPRAADQRGEALSAAEQVLRCIPVVKSFRMEERMRRRIRARYDGVCRTERQISVWDALMQTACSSTSYIPRLCYLLFAGFLVMRGGLTLGTFVAVYDLLNYIIGPSVYFPFLLNSFNGAIASINRIRRIEKLPQAKAVSLGNSSGEAPAIEIGDLTFSYAGGRPVFRNFSFSHRGAGLVALRGPSGCGKTTLLDLTAGLLHPQSGRVGVSGKTDAVGQEPCIFRESVMENIRLGRPGATDGEVAGAAREAGADDFIRALPGGYDTRLGDGNTSLSGGQRQRIALARLLLSDAPVWLLDEPTSALDAQTEEIVLRVLGRRSADKLILVSTHRQSLIACADRVVSLGEAER